MINGNNSSTTGYRQPIEPWNNDKPEPAETNMASIVRVRISAALNGRAVDMLQYEWISLLDGCMFTRYVDPNNGSGGDGNDNGGETLRPAVQTFYEEPVIEGDFTVEADVAFRRPTLAMTAQALVSTWCREMGHGLHDQPRLEILNPEAWFLSCVQLHKNITLNGFELGNFINYGLFISHYTLDMQDRHITNTNVVRKGEMDCLFEHDFRRMAIRFTLGEFSSQRDSYVWHLYKMILDYSSIHSAIVDYSEKDHVALYLNVKYPPKVVIDEPKQRTHLNHYQSSSIQSYGKRSHTFFRTANVLNWGRKLGRSSTIKIIYSLSGNNNRERMLEEFWQILSRLKARAKIHVYFLAVRTNPAATELTDDWISDDIFDSFACYYLVNALCSRGYAVLDQIDARFVTVVADASKINPKATEKALEQLLSAIDEHRYFSILIAFSKLYKRYATSSSDITGTVLSSVEDEYLDVPRNCVRVRKLIVTPTREMLMPPEVMMANRVLRQFGEEYALRVLFRDEDGQKLRGDHMQQGLFKMMVEKLLMEGRKFGQRHYRFLAWSNSQLRDHGCYMYCTTDRGMSVIDIRRWMGDFTASSSVPKYMSRMGQCFTQAQEAVKIPYSENSTIVKIEHDITSVAKDPNTGEPYVFSDGIGRISMALAKKICEQLELDQPVPSAYQIRYAGCKGMLSIDVRLDKNPQGYQLILRDSMKKFSSDTSYVLEIVKYSQPSEVCLNRPLIMILDQVSRKQGCGPRVANEIHKLLEKELFTMSDMLLSEEVSVDALVNHTPLKIDYKKLRDSGFNLTVEPFFRGLLLAVHKYTLKAQLFKAKIEIPFDQGRTMYGVLDETNVLQYGQVFIQFSENRNKPGENVKIYTGKVMVTKNPCVVPGDVRIFEAVYKDALKHLVDVIVFPRNGPRPHTDEMAGSDLDGDEYAVYWNQNLMFNKNEEAMQFPKAKADVIRGGVTDRNMVEFFITYVNQDSIGAVATAHLVMADLKSIYDPVCMSIAKKCSMAVDFPKTGVAAERLTEEERPSKYPDYYQRETRPMYISRRLLGQVFRKVKMVADTVEVGQVEAMYSVDLDPDLEVNGWLEYKARAIDARDRFEHHLQALLDQYGIQDESQLVSGRMISVRNRVSDGEKEDFSFYNTEKIVELRISKIFDKFRRHFFEEFGGEREDLLESPPLTAQQKASAYYMVTYAAPDVNNSERRGRMLSFPWLVWEILAYVKQHKVFEKGIPEEFIEPVHVKLAKAVELYNRLPETEQHRLQLIRQALQGAPNLKFPLLAYGEDLGKLMYVILRWCQKERVTGDDRRLRTEHIAMLFIIYASGLSGYVDKTGHVSQYVLPMDQLKNMYESSNDDFRCSKKLYRPGALCLEFIKYLASQYFRCQKELDFRPHGINSVFSNREWLHLHSVAFKTYHHIAWTLNFRSLHMDDPNLVRYTTLKWDRDELDPIPIRLSMDALFFSRFPSNNQAALDNSSRLLKMWSGMDEVSMRFDVTNRDPNQFLVVGIGSLEARNKLKEILLCDELEEALYLEVCPESKRDF